MAILKARGKESPFLYLSYFKNFDIENKVDYPIFGGETSFTGLERYTVSKETLTYRNVQYPSLRIKGNGGDFFKDQSNVSFDGVFSVDFIAYINSINYNCNFLWFGESVGIVSDWNHGSSRLILVNQTKSYTLHNGATLNYTGYGYIWISVPHSRTETLHHAIQYNDEKGEISIYVEGVLYVKIVDSAGLNYLNFSPRGTNYIELSQLAIRRGDNTINDGMNFPIPSEPYYPAILDSNSASVSAAGNSSSKSYILKANGKILKATTNGLIYKSNFKTFFF